MTTVYVVTTGTYSDYGINAIFSAQALAQEYVDRMNFSPNEYARIDEYEMDEHTEWMKGTLNTYSVYIRKDTADATPVVHRLIGLQEESMAENSNYMVFRLRAENEQHAAKIAMERRSIAIIRDEVLEVNDDS